MQSSKGALTPQQLFTAAQQFEDSPENQHEHELPLTAAPSTLCLQLCYDIQNRLYEAFLTMPRRSSATLASPLTTFTVPAFSESIIL